MPCELQSFSLWLRRSSAISGSTWALQRISSDSFEWFFLPQASGGFSHSWKISSPLSNQGDSQQISESPLLILCLVPCWVNLSHFCLPDLPPLCSQLKECARLCLIPLPMSVAWNISPESKLGDCRVTLILWVMTKYMLLLSRCLQKCLDGKVSWVLENKDIIGSAHQERFWSFRAWWQPMSGFHASQILRTSVKWKEWCHHDHHHWNCLSPPLCYRACTLRSGVGAPCELLNLILVVDMQWLSSDHSIID